MSEFQLALALCALAAMGILSSMKGRRMEGLLFWGLCILSPAIVFFALTGMAFVMVIACGGDM